MTEQCIRLLIGCAAVSGTGIILIRALGSPALKGWQERVVIFVAGVMVLATILAVITPAAIPTWSYILTAAAGFGGGTLAGTRLRSDHEGKPCEPLGQGR